MTLPRGFADDGSELPATAGDPLPAGDVRFYDNYQPPVEAGDYTITVQQKVDSKTTVSGGQALDAEFPQGAPLTQQFSILAPRFTLPATDVHAAFPPASSTGTYGQNLPHIVLDKRALPWERFLQKDNKTTPWLALLLLSPNEIVAPPGFDAGNPLANPTRVSTSHVSQLIDPPAGTLGPTLVPEFQDQLGSVTAAVVTHGGSGYTSPPTVAVSGGAGSGAAATAKIGDGKVIGIEVTAGGSRYAGSPTLELSGGGGSGAAAVALRGIALQTIDLTTDVFAAVTPFFDPTAGPVVDELSYLAHCRQVAITDKEIKETKDPGWFSVVLGNRFPGPGPGPLLDITLETPGLGYTQAPTVTIAGGGGSGAVAVATIDDGQVASVVITQPGTGYSSVPTITLTGGGTGVTQQATALGQIGAPWVAHLISLEGYEDYLSGNPSWPAGIANVRLASLYSWTFTCLSQQGDFASLMEDLVAGQPTGGDGLLLRLPGPAEAPPANTPASQAAAVLAEGYAALGYETRVGDDTFAWYRGPLTPDPQAAFTGLEPFTNAASAMIYDAENGLFDLSYSTAWQIGRLSALSDQRFGQLLLDWRRSNTRLLNAVNRHATRSGPLAELVASGGPIDLTAGDAASVDRLLDLVNTRHSEAFIDHLTGTFAAAFGASIATHTVAPPELEAEPNDPPATPGRVMALQNLMAQPAIQKLIARVNSDPKFQIGPSSLEYLVAWLARLVLLYGIPFDYLVPDARMLPNESIRFFSVDPNYQEALVDGAMSAGAQSSRDTALYSAAAGSLRSGTHGAAAELRSNRLGLDQSQSARAIAAGEPAGPLAGFVLRSAVVAGWPGLEVRGYASSSGDPLVPAGQLQVVRMDRLAVDVLFVLFEQAPAWIEISEPREGLAFGHEDGFEVDLRQVSGTNIGDLFDPKVSLKINSYFRPATVLSNTASPVLDVTSWQAAVQQGVADASGESGLTLGPADFAIEMVRAPEQMIFQNQPNVTLGSGGN